MKTEQERIEEAWKRRIDENILRSRVPLHTRGRNLAELSKEGKTDGNQRAFAVVGEYLKGNIIPPLLLLIGTPGVGKTTLGYCIAWEFLNSGDRVLYYQAEELLNELQSYLEDGVKFARLWWELKNWDLVILDDIGAHNRTTWRDAQLDALVDYRYRERLPLVMTTNRLDNLSERITDRVKEGASAVITGESWRGKAK